MHSSLPRQPAAAKTLLVLLALPLAAIAQISQSDPASGAIGTWRGDSVCVGKNTACHDETVVYRIASVPDKTGTVSVSAAKIVNGNPIEMGTLEFEYDQASQTLVCKYSQ